MTAILSLFAFISAIVSWKLNDRVFNPGTIFFGIQGFQLAVYSAFTGTVYQPLSDRSLVAIATGLIGFLGGYAMAATMAIATKRNGFHHHAVIGSKPAHAKQLLYIGLACAAISAAWHTTVGLQNMSDGQSGNLLLDLRLVYLDNPGGFGLAPHILIFAQFVLLFLYLIGYSASQAIRWMVAVTIYCAFWKMERSAMIMAVYVAAVAIEERNRRLSAKVIAYTLGAVLALFLVISLLRDSYESPVDALTLMLDYFARNLQTFDLLIVGTAPTGDWTQLFGKYAEIFGASVDNQVSVGTDDFFNTYGYLKNLYLFGGEWFPGLYCFGLSLVFGILYNWAAQRSHHAKVLYFFLSFSLFMTFFDFTFSWTNWGYYFISALLVLLITGKYRLSRRSTRASTVAVVS